MDCSYMNVKMGWEMLVARMEEKMRGRENKRK
jgi:hypothetical protein